MERALVALFALALALALALLPATAAAQAPPALSPPRALDAGRVPYPKGATGRAVVILEILVERDGRVREARVVEGVEPFASAAREAALGWTFTPAKRGDETVAARTRMRVEFEEAALVTPPEPAPEVVPPTPASSSSARPAAPPPRPVQEVRVPGARKEVGQVSLGGGEVRQIPGAFGDAFRAIDALPGVTPIVSGLPFFFVRGAPPGNTGYFLDGVRVPLLYHLAVGPSVIHPGLIERVDFFPGGFPARYGRFAGGILSGETFAPQPVAHGEGNVRLFDAGALVETPFAGGRGSALVGGRYSYTAAMLQIFAPDTRLQYWDYQTRATWELGKGERIGVFAFGSYDSLSTRDRPDAPFQEQFGTEFHRIDLRYDRAIGTTGNVRVAATVGFDRSGEQRGSLQDWMAAVRVEADNKLSSDLRVRGGADVVFDHYDLTHLNRSDPTNPLPQSETDALYPSRNDVVMGVWGDVVYRVSPRVELVPGLRFDVFTSRRAEGANPSPPPGGYNPTSAPWTLPVGATAIPTVDPRLATRIALTKGTSLLTTFGISHQPPSFFVPVPGLSLGTLSRGVQTSVQISEGVEVVLPADFTLQTTVFLHDYLDLTDFTATCGNTSDTNTATTACIDQRVRGRTIGAELLLRRPLTKRLTGWLAYTLSRSTREAHPLLGGQALAEIPSEFDRTHVLNVVGAYDLGRGWRAGARFYLYTGRPYSETFRNIPIPPYNDLRMPAFYRLDLRVEKRWHPRPFKYVALVLEWMNVTLNKEVIDENCRPDPNTPLAKDVCTPNEIGPVTVPSVGLEAAF